MPIHDYHCPRCDHDFEALVRGDRPAACPRCGDSASLQRRPSRIAPAGTTAGLIAGARRQAAREGHLSHCSPGERARLLR